MGISLQENERVNIGIAREDLQRGFYVKETCVYRYVTEDNTEDSHNLDRPMREWHIFL
jgi:hypothetical protein